MAKSLQAGEFFGRVGAKCVCCGATMCALEHAEPKSIPVHAHEKAFFSLLIGGAYRERYRGRWIEYAPMTGVFHPPGYVHLDEIGRGGGRFFTVEFEARWMDVEGGEREPRFELEGGRGAWIALELSRSLRGPDVAVESLLAELAGELRRVPSPRGARPRWLDRVEERLRAEYRDPPGLDALARDAGVHPVHLSRTFRRHRGMSIAEALWRLKAREAAALSREMPLADAAAEAGFADQAHLTRVMRRVAGRTPGDVRAAMAVAGRVCADDRREREDAAELGAGPAASDWTGGRAPANYCGC